MVKRALILVVLLLIIMARPVMAEEANTGTIEGLLVNRTQGSNNQVSAQTVTLRAYKDNVVVDSKIATSGSDGKFTFAGLSTDPVYIYEIGATYQEVDYYGEPLQFKSGEVKKTAQIDVFDTTTSDENVSVMMSHAVITYKDSALNVKEYYLVINDSDRTYIGQKISDTGESRETLVLSLAAGAINFQKGYGLTDYTIANGSELHDGTPISPAGREISFSYIIPCNTDTYTLSWKAKYNINRFDLLLPDQDIKVSSPKLIEGSPLNISSQTYRDFVGQNIVSGDTITVQLASLLPAAKGSNFNWLWIALVLPVAFIGFLLFKRRRTNTVTGGTDQEGLLAEIAELDDSFEAQEISEEAYLKIRQEKKQQLMKLLGNGRG